MEAPTIRNIIVGLFSCTKALTYNLELVPQHCVVETHCSSGTGEMQRNEFHYIVLRMSIWEEKIVFLVLNW